MSSIVNVRKDCIAALLLHKKSKEKKKQIGVNKGVRQRLPSLQRCFSPFNTLRSIEKD